MAEKKADFIPEGGMGLSLKILIPLVLSTGLVILVFTAYLIHDQRRQKESLLLKKADAATTLLAQANREALWNYNALQMETLSRSFFEDPDITDIIIRDHRGNIQVKLHKDITGSKQFTRNARIHKDEETIGSLEIVFTHFDIEQALSGIRTRLILMAAVLFLTLTGLIILISRILLTRPLSRVIDGITHVSKGNYHHQIQVNTGDEIGQLARQFNAMAGRITRFQDKAVATAEIRKEMQIAKDIQMSLQPNLEGLKDLGFSISAAMSPAEDIGGDYYDVIRSGDNHLWFAIGDVTGHGLLSGLVMMMAQVSINTLVRSVDALSPEDVLIYANQTIQSNIRQGLKKDHHMTLTLIKQEAPGRYRYAGAHEIMLIYRAAAGTVEAIQTRGMWLGVIPDISKPTRKYAGSFTLEKNDILLLYTDGVIELKNKQMEQYDIRRLSQFLQEHGGAEPHQIRESLLSDLHCFKHRQTDDITFMLIKKE